MNRINTRLPDLIFQRAGRCCEHNLECYFVSFHLHIIDHIERHEILFQIGIINMSKRIQDVIFGY